MPPVKISTTEARKALRDLVKALDKANVKVLGPQSRAAKTTTADEWVEMLRTAEAEIAQWCPNQSGSNAFTFELPEKQK